MRGIYLAAFKANHPNHDLVYQDIDGKRDIGGENVHVVIERFIQTIEGEHNGN